ncbi:hypothetical protein HZB02_06260 [Candidatus Woesearchaeota archaeon]|nr:hypothetical protein [Candidatus Woesearchaeota archaeon]
MPLIDAEAAKARLQKFGFKDQEMAEDTKDGNLIPTEYPKAAKRYRFTYESFSVSVEESYFFMLDYLRHDRDFSKFYKVIDQFSAAEQSSFFGSAQQRLGIQQDKVSGLLATIGKMVKELFQLVRELRVLDERLSYYRDSYTGSRSSESAEIVLKGIWIDMVEQGSKNPASVYGMARELQFTTLPDLFFRTHPQTAKDVDELVDALQFNRKVKEVLKRKLRSFIEWKDYTYGELKVKRKFTLKYLKQHYDIIRMYMNWVKPYLRSIRRLTLDTTKASSEELIAAFEGSIVEIETLAVRMPKHNHYLNSCVLLHLYYVTRPSMSYQNAAHQGGPLHVGKVTGTVRAYVWDDKQVENYLKMKEEEDLELLGVVDSSVRTAMEALGNELQTYLKEAGEESFQTPKEDHHPVRKPGILDPFVSIFKGFAEIGGGGHGSHDEHGKGHGSHGKSNKKQEDLHRAHEESATKKDAKDAAFNTYKEYKKTHKMLTW